MAAKNEGQNWLNFAEKAEKIMNEWSLVVPNIHDSCKISQVLYSFLHLNWQSMS